MCSPCKIIFDADTEELEAAHPHSNPLNSDVSLLTSTSFPFPLVNDQLLGFLDIQGKIVILAPLHHDIYISPVIVMSMERVCLPITNLSDINFMCTAEQNEIKIWKRQEIDMTRLLQNWKAITVGFINCAGVLSCEFNFILRFVINVHVRTDQSQYLWAGLDLNDVFVCRHHIKDNSATATVFCIISSERESR